MKQARHEMYIIAREIDRIIQSESMSPHDMRKKINDLSTKLKALAARRDWVISELPFLEE